MPTCEICGESFDGYRQLNGHKSVHYRTSTKSKQLPTKRVIDNTEYECKFCQKVCVGKRSLAAHECSCPKNENRKYKSHTIGHTAWNKGLTKETSSIIKNASDKIKGTTSGFTKGSQHSIETKEKISSTMAQKNIRHPVASKRVEYNGVTLDSSWELKVAKDLDSNGIAWIRPGALSYIDESNQKRHYFPDFYLVEFNVYLDPKNDYVKKRDFGKIQRVQEQNDVLIYCLNKHQLSWKEIQSLIGPLA